MSHLGPRPWRHRLSLGRKAGLLVGSLAAGLVLLTLQNVRELAKVRLDARTFVEETREAHAAQALQSTIEQLGLLARQSGVGALANEREVLLDRMESHLRVLASGRPGPWDPSRSEHESAEQAILSELFAGLVRLRESDASEGARDTMELLWRMEVAATDVREETEEEAALASVDLERRVRGLIGVLGVTALAAVLLLLLLYRLVHRHVVTPVIELRAGARLFGQGRLEHRIRIGSTDELGELADEFNDMADRLTDTHRDLETRVRERTAEFVRAARLADLGTFAAGVAHEVNTPLATIASCAEGLQRRIAAGELAPDQEAEYLETIAEQAYRARDITSRLLAFARQDRGPVGRVDLGEVVERVAGLVGHELARRDLRLEIDCPEELPAVEGNGAELEHVVLNLVLNARDASPRGHLIRLGVRADDGEVVLEVVDQGHGIPAADRGRIFDPFFTTKPPGEGTGLGLSIVFRILESHGGSVELTGADGGGTRFLIRLPALAAVREPS